MHVLDQIRDPDGRIVNAVSRSIRAVSADSDHLNQAIEDLVIAKSGVAVGQSSTVTRMGPRQVVHECAHGSTQHNRDVDRHGRKDGDCCSVVEGGIATVAFTQSITPVRRPLSARTFNG